MNRALIALLCAPLAQAALARQADTPATPREVQPAQPVEAVVPAKSSPKAADKPNLYDESADAKTLINAALAKAKTENRRVLLQWGFNSCFWCQLMHREFENPRGKLAGKLRAEYDVVHIEAAKNQANKAVAEGYGAELNKYGYPYLTILDASGKAVANQETGGLEVKDEKGESLIGEAAAHDEAKMLAFLTKHQAAYLQADAVVKDGIDQAKASGKKVFLHFGAPWCIWCHRLEDWLAQDQIAAIVGKDFVDVKVDQDRMVGAKEVGARYGMPEKTGIPWFAVIDPATGKVLCDSMDGTSTIGYPVEPSEITHFMGMLDKTHKNMSKADLDVIRASLMAAAEKYKTRH